MYAIAGENNMNKQQIWGKRLDGYFTYGNGTILTELVFRPSLKTTPP